MNLPRNVRVKVGKRGEHVQIVDQCLEVGAQVHRACGRFRLFVAASSAPIRRFFILLGAAFVQNKHLLVFARLGQHFIASLLLSFALQCRGHTVVDYERVRAVEGFLESFGEEENLKK